VVRIYQSHKCPSMLPLQRKRVKGYFDLLVYQYCSGDRNKRVEEYNAVLVYRCNGIPTR
jgi:hypothetical protein